MATTATLTNERTDRHEIESRARGEGEKTTSAPSGVAVPTHEENRSRRASGHRSRGLIPCRIGGRTWYLAERPYQDDARADLRSRLPSALVVLSLVVGLLFFLLFGIDLIAAWPFHRHSVEMDVAYLICGTALMYLSWETSRDFR